MATFDELWQLLYDNGSSNYYKHDCFVIWNELTTQQREKLYSNIAGRIRDGKYVAYNPLNAIHDNLPRRAAVRRQTLTYEEYYRIYRTTNPIDGWQMQKGEDGKVFYTKTQQV